MTSVPESIVESILAADVGSTLTKAVLIDLVDGEFRVLATAEYPTTLEPPWSDISLAVQQCVSRLEVIAGRKLLDERGALITPERVDGNGVDAFLATASAAEPLRVAIAGLARDFSVESARKATLTTYALPETLLALHGAAGKDAPNSASKWDLPGRMFALHDHMPAVILLVGGSEKGTNAPLLDVANAVAMSCATWPEVTRPDVIFAGSGSAREQIAQMMGEGVRLSVVDNIRPEGQSENLEALENELEAMYVERRLNRLPGIGRLAGESNQPIVATSRAFGAGVRALARHFEICVLGADVGSSTTTLAVSEGEQFTRAQRSDLGVSHHIETVARTVGMQNVLRWLPLAMSEKEAWDRLANKSIRPFTLPVSRNDLLLEQAIAREALRLTLRDLQLRWQRQKKAVSAGDSLTGVDLVIGSGGVLSHAPLPEQSVLMLLDALQPVGLTNLALDSGGLLPQLSLIAAVQPQAAAHMAAREGVVALGTAICPVGAVKAGELVLTYKLSYKEGEAGTVSGEVHAGEIEVLPLGPGRKASLELKPAPNIDLSMGRGRTAVTNVEGGLVGVVIDARGRPLLLSDDAEKRAATNQQWLYNMGA